MRSDIYDRECKVNPLNFHRNKQTNKLVSTKTCCLSNTSKLIIDVEVDTISQNSK